MKKSTCAFTLIEIIIATSILTITVFWIYKLIWENSKIVSNSNISVKTTLLFPVIEACIENSLITSDKYFYIWEDFKLCEANDNLKVNKIDNIEYTFQAVKKSENNSWEIQIYSDFTWTQTWTYIKKNRD
jgi:prepilin-type N-terminal cleavage/methylation domain-containing protein